MKQYRIGEFAKHLGVTPDLLKHYEEQGIISSVRSKGGYRYYSFNTSPLLMESIRLRNYGMTLREIHEILQERSVSEEAMTMRLQQRVEDLRKENSLNEALILDYEEFCVWQEALDGCDADWSIRRSREMLFLPHVDQYDFLEDERIYELLQEWMSRIPIVKSSMQIGLDGRIIWGFIVPAERAQKLGLPVNGAVEHIPAQKVFYYQFRGPLRSNAEEVPDAGHNPALHVMASMNLSPAGSIYRTAVMPCDWARGLLYQYAYYAVPLTSAPVV